MIYMELLNKTVALPSQIAQDLLNTPTNVDDTHTLKLGEAMARVCINASRMANLSRDDRKLALRVAKGLMEQMEKIEAKELAEAQEDDNE